MKNLCLIAAVFCFACGGGDSTIDPTGTYDLTIVWGSGDCELTGTDTTSFTVTEDPDGDAYLFGGDFFEETTSSFGVVECTEDECELSLSAAGSFVQDGVQIDFEQTLDLVTDGEDVDGSGDLMVSAGGGSCSQQFTVEGSQG